MRLIAWLLTEVLREAGGIQAFLIRHISRAKVSNLQFILKPCNAKSAEP